MGKCGDENTKPYKFTLDELADVAIDDTKEMIRGCGPNADGTHETWLYNRGWGWPDNGEFEYYGLKLTKGNCEKAIEDLTNNDYKEFYLYLANNRPLNEFLANGKESIFNNFKQCWK